MQHLSCVLFFGYANGNLCVLSFTHYALHNLGRGLGGNIIILSSVFIGSIHNERGLRRTLIAERSSF